MMHWIMKTLHHWFGAIFAAFFFVISISGSWLVIDKYVFVPSLPVEQSQLAGSKTLEQDRAFVSKLMEIYPLEDISQIKFPIEEQPFYAVKLSNGRVDYFHKSSLAVFEKPMSGPVTKFMNRIHTNLLNPWSIGHEIVIWTGLIAIFLTVTGLLIFIPSRRSFRKNRILLPRELSFKDVRRTHLSSAVVFSGFIVFFGATGWVIGEPEAARQVLSSQEAVPIEVSETLVATIKAGDISKTLEAVKTQLPGQKITVIEFSKDIQNEAIYLHTKKADDFALHGNERFKIDLAEGKLLQLVSGDGKAFASNMLNNAYALHTGEGRSVFYKIMISILGVIVAIVSLMGLLSYILKWRMKILGALSRRQKESASRQEPSA